MEASLRSVGNVKESNYSSKQKSFTTNVQKPGAPVPAVSELQVSSNRKHSNIRMERGRSLIRKKFKLSVKADKKYEICKNNNQTKQNIMGFMPVK